MLPGATGAPGAELAALTMPPELMEGAGWAHAPVRLASRHAQPVRRMALNADMEFVRSLPHGGKKVLGVGFWVLAYSSQTVEEFASTQHPAPSPATGFRPGPRSRRRKRN